MLEIAQFGAGRIGQIHASNIAALKDARLRYVVDVNADAAQKLAARYGAKVVTEREAFADPEVGAVLIASSTDTHARLAIAAARAGKPIFCEKPIDLSLKKVDQCLAEVQKAGVPMFVGFNRRFDPSFSALKRRLDAGEVGAVEQVVITSRDPAPPPLAYLKVSGGMFRDMTIHDFDMARFLLGEEPVSVSAVGSVLVDPEIAGVPDVDSAAITLVTATGKIAQISNSRRAAYGYDQRIEVHGSAGLARAENLHETTVEVAGEQGFTRAPLMNFFIERYMPAYRDEVATFVRGVLDGTPLSPTGEAGLQALILAEAAARSHVERRTVDVSEI
jgi:myo-inositol 2-dehydrogenase/D-chiro-inositol 1-dehydrogenase